MTTSFRHLLWAVALVVTAGVPLVAQERESTPTRGRVLVLDNERVVEGDIERLGTQYRVRRTLGETWIPGEKVLFLANDIKEAYRLLYRRANPDDPDERLRLARWCHGQGLNDLALENVRVAVKLRPNHAASRRLLESLERTAQASASRPAGGGASAAAPTTPPSNGAALPEVTTETLGAFATRVQPILMNACAGCHAGGRGGSFQLARAYDNTTSSRRSVQQNLAAVLAQVNLAQPQASPLLTKAVSAHGNVTQAPLAGKQLAAYRALEEWVERTLASNPQLRDSAPPAVPREAPPTAVPMAPAPTAPPTPAPGRAAEAAPGKFAQGRPTPPPTGPVDPFDPIEFNKTAPPPPKP